MRHLPARPASPDASAQAPRPGPSVRIGLGAVWSARELLLSFVQRDLTVRYRYALLGIVWAILTPLFQMVIFALIFTRVVRIDTGMPYPLYAFTGLAVWSCTAGAWRGAVSSLSANAYLVSKVRFQREVLPLAAVTVATVDFIVSLGVVGALMWYYGIPLHATAFLLPVLLVVHIGFTAGVAMLLAAANLFWHDVRYVFEVVITLWMFATTVLYPVPPIASAIGVLLSLNPLTRIIDAYRDILLRGTLPDPAVSAAMLGCATVALLGGLAVFQRAEPRFAEVA